MLRRNGWVLGICLLGSLLVNGYLVERVYKWQEAWTEQILTTSVVEHLYKKSDADLSYQGVRDLVERELGKYEEIQAGEAGLDWPKPSDRVIVVDGTKLIFKDGQYVGSKADLPEGLEHWHGDGPF
jgi:hypothetical protein